MGILKLLTLGSPHYPVPTSSPVALASCRRPGGGPQLCPLHRARRAAAGGAAGGGAGGDAGAGGEGRGAAGAAGAGDDPGAALRGGARKGGWGKWDGMGDFHGDDRMLR